MTKKVTLREVTADNWERVAKLKLHKDQADFLENNAMSIAESKFNPYAVPRAVYAGKRPVGFIMWETMEEDDAPHDYAIYRVMIDKKHQGKGYGRKAMDLALAEIRKDSDWRRIVIFYWPENKAAKDLYASFGFREVGVDEDGEVIAEILAP